MKYKAKLYAKALSSAILEEDADENKILDNFLKFLEKNGDMGKAFQIVFLAKKLFIKKTGRRQLTIESARKIKAKQKELVNSILQKGDIVEEKINKDLLAGIKIIINGEKQFDASLKSKLQKIF
ncbi:MAG: hypothetical protein US35_C0006G0005 [Parcubacteria group bacterium GW2011_GWA2_37_10]|nr:MAG: hypothetical protein US35_C0006G0005 [Parcubacteria group bacterium GW2011_GWA2_37_10]